MTERTIIAKYFPNCGTWKDIALSLKQSLNPRTLKIGSREYDDALWSSEIMTQFECNGMDHKEAKDLLIDLEKMGFLTTLDKVLEPEENRVIGFLV